VQRPAWSAIRGVALVDAGAHEQDDDRADDAGRLEEVVLSVLMEDQVAQDPPDERADDDNDRGQDADVLSNRDQQPATFGLVTPRGQVTLTICRGR
jgi:hypothetical protein